MEICLEVQGGIEQGLAPPSDLGEISISEALTALGSEPGESKNLPFSESTTGVSILLNYPKF